MPGPSIILQFILATFLKTHLNIVEIYYIQKFLIFNTFGYSTKDAPKKYVAVFGKLSKIFTTFSLPTAKIWQKVGVSTASLFL